MENCFGRNRSNATAARQAHLSWARNVVIFVGVHALAALAPVTFTWTGLWLALGLYILTGLGISMGYHRLFAHRSFVGIRPLRWLLGLLGALAVQGGPIRWCAMHRLHHRHSDRPADPQQAASRFWRSHLGWLMTDRSADGRLWQENCVVAGLRREPFLRKLEAAYLSLNALFAAVLFAVGWLSGGWLLAISLLTWGVGVRVVALWHCTLLMNSIAHRWGYRNYATHDNSRNVWWLAPISFGECWHNNHHVRPGSADHGHRWFEFDPVFLLISVLYQFGVVTSINCASCPGEGRDTPLSSALAASSEAPRSSRSRRDARIDTQVLAR